MTTRNATASSSSSSSSSTIATTMTGGLHVFVGIAALASVLLLFSKRKHFYRYRDLPLPPGPKGWPIIGNLLDIPEKRQWVAYHEWAKELGSDVLCLSIAGTNTIIIDKHEAAVALLERRSAIYSGRPRMVMPLELMGWDFSFGFMDYGEKWRQHRRLMNEEFNIGAAKQFRPQLLKSSRRLLKRFLRNPTDIKGNFKHMIGDNMLTIAYGLQIKPNDDPYINAAEAATASFFRAAVPGKYLVDSLPWLRYVPEWVPGAGFQRVAKEYRELKERMVEEPWKEAMRRIEAGTSDPCFLALNVAKMQDAQSDSAPATTDEESTYLGQGNFRSVENVKHVSAAFYAAGMDTSLSALSTCILGLIYNPHIIKRAQAELDSVLRPGDLPEYEDMEALPYIKAIVKETLRWRTITPLSIPRRLGAEDVYMGYRIPEGAVVMANTWAILHDEEIYPDPFTFNPDRFITSEGKFDESVPDPEMSCWGYGRRICMGRHLASDTITIVIASLLRAFDIGKMVGEDGSVVEPRDVPKGSLIIGQEPYECKITPRSEEWRRIVEAEET